MSKWQTYLDNAAASLTVGDNLVADVWLRLAFEYRMGFTTFQAHDDEQETADISQ